MKRGNKKIILLGIVVLIIVPLISAGFFEWVKTTISGKATDSPVILNITIAGSNTPIITWVGNESFTDTTASGIVNGPTEGPLATTMIINFTAYDGDGFGNLNDSTARINLTLTGQDTRFNGTCENLGGFSTYYSNYTCNITIWWWDGPGIWTINASIFDNDDNFATNYTTNFTIGTTNGFLAAPTSLNWGTVSAGITNNESVDNPVIMNNTGNQLQDIQINSTNLRGETDDTQAIWAGNFSVNFTAGCEGVFMNATGTGGRYMNISTANLTAGNFTIDNNYTGQEELFFCAEVIGSELTAQSYSTANESTWTLDISA